METQTYLARRQQLETYFDRTAVDAWAKLTADGPVSRIRATVRAGRDAMRATLLKTLPDDLTGQRVLDAGCGTGALAVEAARRGAHVVAIDLSPKLIDLARQRTSLGAEGALSTSGLQPSARDLRQAPFGASGSIDFRVSDMLDPSLGRFDWVVAMDSLIHYQADDMTQMVAQLAARADRGVTFTFAPSTVLLELMKLVGKIFPRSDRSPDIEPIREATLRRLLGAHPGLKDFHLGASERIDTMFYKSQSLHLHRP